MRRRLGDQYHIFLSFLLVSACAAALAPSTAPAGPVQQGEQIFQTRCSACHTIGGGRKVGPDLQGVTKEQPRTWLYSFISDPEKMFAASDPHAMMLLNEYKIKMPNMGLSPDEVNAVLGYFETKAGAAPPAPKEQAPAIPQTESKAPSSGADAERGEKYFTGELAFKNNGPPCMACHSVAGMKYFGGGSLGPDLTTAYSALGPGIVSMLTNVPFPTMKPIFDSHSLTAAEAGDLAAFLQTAASRQPESLGGRITTASLIVFVVLLIVIQVLWRKRLVSVRKAMVERANQEGDRR